MPEAEEHHKLLDKLGLSNYKWVSDLMDSNRGLLPSPIHRLAPPHDPLSGLLLTVAKRDLNVLKAHIVHNLQDLLSDPGYPIHVLDRVNRTLRKTMENMKKAGR